MPKIIIEEGQKAQEQQLVKARELYKQEKYQAALFTYNKASHTLLQRESPNTVKIIENCSAPIDPKAFDGRAATHVKLRNYAPALKDAKQLIVLVKTDVKVNRGLISVPAAW